jgi:hypothetical protein
MSVSGLTATDPRTGTGSMVNLSVIRTMVNESQRRGNSDHNLNSPKICYLTESYPGSHTPQGRVTAMSQHISIPHARITAVSQQVSRNPALNVPTVNNPSFFQNYFENHAHAAHHPSSLDSPSLSQTIPGYSPAHLQYQDERNRWAAMAYKTPSGQIPLRAQARKEVRVLFQLSHQLLSGKVEKVTVISFQSVLHSFLKLISTRQ